MQMVRIAAVVPLEGRRVRLTLTDGTTVERDLSALLVGPLFQEIRENPAQFREVRVEAGALAWPDGADLCPDTVIWGGLPPVDTGAAPEPDRLDYGQGYHLNPAHSPSRNVGQEAKRRPSGAIFVS
jgi:hypothetical protein